MAVLGIVLIFILWTWELTPLWVNIISTIMIVLEILRIYGKTVDEINARKDKEKEK